MDVNPEAVVKSPFFVGLLGAFVSLRGAPGKTWGDRALTVVTFGRDANHCEDAYDSEHLRRQFPEHYR